MECNKTFSIRTQLVKHVKAVHNKIRSRKELCNICDKELCSKLSLNNHIISKHADEEERQQRRTKCFICVKEFSSKACLRRHSLNYHMSSKHGEKREPQQRRIKWNISDDVSASKEPLWHHMRIKQNDQNKR